MSEDIRLSLLEGWTKPFPRALPSALSQGADWDQAHWPGSTRDWVGVPFCAMQNRLPPAQ
jgi:hypothetical protein